MQDPPSKSVLREMTLQERILADYRQSGMSVGSHPIRFLRPFLEQKGAQPANALGHLRPGMKTSVAGIITVRQRPMTAKGFLFITLEDETGFSNLIVAPPIFEKYRRTIITAEGLWAEGTLQIQDQVVHLRTHTILNLSDILTSSKTSI
jgi:error-prone DNA polymerase